MEESLQEELERKLEEKNKDLQSKLEDEKAKLEDVIARKEKEYMNLKNEVRTLGVKKTCYNRALSKKFKGELVKGVGGNQGWWR